MPPQESADRPDTPGMAARELESELLGGQRRYTRREVAALAGVDFERARRLWVALGFAEVSDDDVVFTEGDLDALVVWDSLVRSSLIAADREVSVARVLGQAFSGIAEWEVREVTARSAEALGAPADTETENANGLAAAILPVVEQLHSYVWRRHLAAAAGRALRAPDEQLTASRMVVGFADIVGYTSTTRHLDNAELAELLETFESDAAATVAERNGRVVKNVGDEVLFVVGSAVDAAEVALSLTAPDRAERGLSTLRVGMAMGNVLSRHGDVYGAVVNLAARLTSSARPQTTLVDRELAAELRKHPEYRLRSRRPVGMRGYPHMRSWGLRRARG